MQDDSWIAPPFSRTALHIFGVLDRHGGTMRVGPLLQQSSLSCDELAAACNELAERCWVKIAPRNSRTRMPAGLPERCRAIDRITTTRFGRDRYPVTWSTR